ncbi:hypothetical protein [Thiocystis minor]|nr:hypothetical protein [Thiocystis minor]
MLHVDRCSSLLEIVTPMRLLLWTIQLVLALSAFKAVQAQTASGDEGA